jgi:cold shock CspA family protein
MSDINVGVVKWYDHGKRFGFIRKIPKSEKTTRLVKPTSKSEQENNLKSTEHRAAKLQGLKIISTEQSSSELQELFFHIKNSGYNSLSEGDLVVFQQKESSKHAGKVEATAIVLLRDSERLFDALEIIHSAKITFDEMVIKQIAESVSKADDILIINKFVAICGDEISETNLIVALRSIDVINYLIRTLGRLELTSFYESIFDRTVPDLKIRLIVRAFESFSSSSCSEHFPSIVNYYNSSDSKVQRYVLSRMPIVLRLQILQISEIVDDETFKRSLTLFDNQIRNDQYHQLISDGFNISHEFKIKFWELGYTSIIDLAFLADMINNNSSKLSIDWYKKLDENQRKELLPKLTIEIDNEDSFKKITDIISIDRKQKHFQELMDARIKIAPEFLLKFWIEGYTENLDIDYLATLFLRNAKSFAGSYFKKLSLSQRHNFYSKIYMTISESSPYSDDKVVLELVRLIRLHDHEIFLDYCKRIEQLVSDHIKLRLWINDCIQTFDFDLYKSLVVLLSTSAQKIFLKKVFYLKRSGHFNLTIKNLEEIKDSFFDFEFNNRAIDHASHDSLDYSVSVAIQIILDLSRGKKTEAENIYQIVAKQINNPKDILHLTGFFDKCEGRLGLYRSTENSSRYQVSESRGAVPENLEFCEGRIATNKQTGEHAKCESSDKKYWWCRNSRCYAPSRGLHDNYKDYTILDFLDILNIKYNSDDYELLLGFVNKINRFFAHLNCKECGNILLPKGQGNYGFYRVSLFGCSNQSCGNFDQPVYLTHCLNGRCTNIVDSRESVKCKPDGVDQNTFGWYVCNSCSACCSGRVLETRAHIYSATGQEYAGHKIGHLDLGQVCCHDCGTVMLQPNDEDYNRVLTGLKQLAHDKSPTILQSGISQNGRYWFLIQVPPSEELSNLLRKKLHRYQLMGFNVPDLDDRNKNSYLVHEPTELPSFNLKVFKCPECGFILDLSKDHIRYKVFKSYHVKVFE